MQIDGEAITVVGGLFAGMVTAIGMLWRQNSVLTAAVRTEMQNRIDDAKAALPLVLKMNETVIIAVNEAKASDTKVATEIAENTKATRELTAMLSGDQREPTRQVRRPMGSRP